MMLTRCPECATVFRVTPEQLKARQGSVRCGRCHRVFNAIDALIENLPANVVSPPEPQPATNVLETEPLPETADESTDAKKHAPEDATDYAPIPEIAAETVPPQHDTEPAHEPQATVPVAVEPGRPEQAEHEPPVATVVLDAQATEPLALAPAPGGADIAAAEPAMPVPPETLAPDSDDGMVEGQYVAEPLVAAPPAMQLAAMEPLLHEPPRQPPPWPWVFAAVVFATLLVGQTALFYRVELAIQYPQLRASFESICEQINCEMPLPRHIELVSIEASDLNPDAQQKDRLRLSATLKNRAEFAQEYPHLELTLTDTQDRPLLRRALAPAEYLTSAPPPAGFAARGETAVALTIDASSVPASGYRLYLFYP